MIHGNKVSVGCIAIGDSAIEEIFVLAAKSDYTKWKIISTPVDFRLGEIAPPSRQQVAWLQSLYKEISLELTALPLP